jgi:N-acetylglucosamine-6-phosphate deacetylase
MQTHQIESTHVTAANLPAIFLNLQRYDHHRALTVGHVYIDQQGRCRPLANAEVKAISDQGVPVFDMALQAVMLPGFYETHIHGYAGHDFSTSLPTAEALKKTCAAMLALGATGVTAVMPTTVTLSIADLKARLAVLDEYVQQEQASATPGAPTVTGIHLEGPFISCLCKGAHDAVVLAQIEKQGISLALFQDIIAAAPHIDHWKITIDPSLTGMIPFLQQVKQGLTRPDGTPVYVYPFIGHTNPSPDILQAALATGAIRGFTHLGNAMGETAHRQDASSNPIKLLTEKAQSNVVRLALATAGNFNQQPLFSELIVDGAHLSKEFVTEVAATIGHDRVVLITDALGFTGLADGQYTLGTVPVVKKGDQFWIVDTNDHTCASTKLAGSAASYAKVVSQYYQWLDKQYESVLLAGVINPRMSVAGPHAIDFNDEQNFVILNQRGELVLNACNGKVYAHGEMDIREEMLKTHRYSL